MKNSSTKWMDRNMESYFASPERASDEDLKKEILHISQNPIIDSLLNTVEGLVAVLNVHRQIIAVNETYLNAIGVKDSKTLLGLRPGESVKCIHANDMPGGCGTSEFCASCGAVIAIVSSLETDKPTEKKCVLTITKDKKTEELFLKVRACPIYIENKRFLLLFLNDISKEQSAATIERIFFHDINNLVYAIQGRAELLALDKKENQFSQDIYNISKRLAKEIDIQRSLYKKGLHTYTPDYSKISVSALMDEIKQIFNNHPLAKQKKLVMVKPETDVILNTDYSLLVRILINMLTNAFEASENGSLIRFEGRENEKNMVFSVFNPAFIPYPVAKRIFQRNFSTKSAIGRGLGTYSMKFFGEDILGGKVGFKTSEEDGTQFWISLVI